MAFVAVGYPGLPTSTPSWDWWPLAGIALTLWFVRSVLRRSLGAIDLAVALVAGVVFAAAVHTWGIPGGAGIVLGLLAAGIVLRRRPQGRTPPAV
jgi:hypothetical protein